ncbi:dihydrofolate reductase family protein [Emticicia sp. 17c]|uniref:dihydrofolate reductase family protein n=1 Tax=Emticicia sp. 17c TaxID=3127704 RepID=UPI00301D2F2D
MRKLIAVAQTSLDGYVAGPNGEFDNFSSGEDSLRFVCSLTDEADAALFGRVSYQLLNAYWPTAAELPEASQLVRKYSKWYNDAKKIVLSTTLPTTQDTHTTIVGEHLHENIVAMKKESGKNILLFGSPTAIHSLIDIGQIDGFWVIIHPVIFGDGIRLFQPHKQLFRLRAERTRLLPNGVQALYYSVMR